MCIIVTSNHPDKNDPVKMAKVISQIIGKKVDVLGGSGGWSTEGPPDYDDLEKLAARGITAIEMADY